MTQNEETQREELRLLPEEMPEVVRTEIPLAELPPNDLLAGPPPTPELVRSIRDYGLMQPIVVSENAGAGPKWTVHGGRRRIQAKREIGDESIDSYVVGADAWGDLPGETLTILLNATAKPNAVAELESIEKLIAGGADEKEISRATGLKLGTIRARLRLSELHPDLRDALRQNKLSMGNAYTAVKLSRAGQERLAAVYAEKGKLVHADVDEERRRKVAVSTEALGLDDLGVPTEDLSPAEAPAVSDDAAGSASAVPARGDGTYDDGQERTREMERVTFERSKEEAETLSRAREHLSAKVEALRDMPRAKRPKWSVEDAAAVEELLKHL